jgi:YgiT-type zinc finger domain-containing protein
MTGALIEIECPEEIDHECPQCGSTRLRQDLVKSAIWQGERLVVVEGIPALLCEACGERLYDDETVTQLDLLQGDGFPEDGVGRFLRVPVIPFAVRFVSGENAEAEDAA